MLDESGNTVNSYQYDEWGNILIQQETVDNPLKYCGEYYDDESGLYYLRARYYDPALGRFVSKDPVEGDITNPLSLNRYAYCAGNPLIYVDPSGCGYVVSVVKDLDSNDIGLSFSIGPTAAVSATWSPGEPGGMTWFAEQYVGLGVQANNSEEGRSIGLGFGAGFGRSYTFMASDLIEGAEKYANYIIEYLEGI